MPLLTTINEIASHTLVTLYNTLMPEQTPQKSDQEFVEGGDYRTVTHSCA